MSGRFADAIPGLFGALFGAGVLGCLPVTFLRTATL
jgi:hypothetical protein